MTLGTRIVSAQPSSDNDLYRDLLGPSNAGASAAGAPGAAAPPPDSAAAAPGQSFGVSLGGVSIHDGGPGGGNDDVEEETKHLEGGQEDSGGVGVALPGCAG